MTARSPRRTPPDKRVYRVHPPFSGINHTRDVCELNPYGRGGSVLRAACKSAEDAASALASLKERDRKERERCLTST